MRRLDPRRFAPRKSHKVGMSPGTVVPVEVGDHGPVRLDVIEYDSDGVRETPVETVEECLALRDSSRVTWINVTGLHDTGVVEGLGQGFGLHPLVLEDVVNTEQRPKLEDYGEYLFVTMKMLTWRRDPGAVAEEQVSLVLGQGWVVSFQERPGDVFDPLRDRIRHGRGRIRTLGADYLAYSLVDAVVDHYFTVLEGLADRLMAAEAELLDDPDEETLQEMHDLKRELLHFRRAVRPVREVTGGLGREGTSRVGDRVRVFAHDVHDHAVQVVDTSETMRDLVDGMLNTYMTTVSNRMNEVMKVLTVTATIFIPLTFIAGVYGMNFEHMPELGWPWAYPAVLVAMTALGGGMFVYFKRRGWI